MDVPGQIELFDPEPFTDPDLALQQAMDRVFNAQDVLDDALTDLDDAEDAYDERTLRAR